MAIAVVASGTQTATLATEHTLATSTTAKTYVLKVDCANLANGETVELKLYDIVLAAGAEGLGHYATFSHLQGEKIKYSEPIPANVSIRATLEQNGGTGRAFPWSLLSID